MRLISGVARDLEQLLQASPAEAHPPTDGWLADNVLKPFANGTGLIQVYDTIADKPVDTYKVPTATTFSANWCVQSVSGAAGAIIPYVIAGKVTGLGMRAMGEGLSLTGGAARVMASESVAQIAGAGMYEFAQKPLTGQTRTGNAAGTMAGFALFSGGELALGKITPQIASPLASALGKGVGRLTVGAVGGLGSYETSNAISGLLGVRHKESWDERFQTMAQGSFVYFALPVVQEGAAKIVDKAIYSQPGSKGLPIQREIKDNGYNDPELQGLVHDNALARVKRGADAQTQADVPGNRVVLSAEDGAAKLAHEMTHLKLARAAEPMYQKLAEFSKTNPEMAQQAYYGLRAEMELAARQSEGRVQTRVAGSAGYGDQAINPAIASASSAAPEAAPNMQTIGTQHAVDVKTYNDVWKAEWQQFKADPNYRPPVEYSGIVKWTGKYEKWMADQIKVVDKDLDKKHVDMASDPFKFLRATYYRWAKMFPKVCEDLQDAPKVRSVGDLHIDNFGTWKDKLGRLIWGVNDFDEAYKLPYTNDLVRLMTSANLLRDQNHLKIGLKDANEAVLDGYKQGLKDGGKPFVLTGDNGKLAKIAAGQMPDAVKYWDHLTSQLDGKSDKKVPSAVSKALASILPRVRDSISWGHRQAGEGSLGRQRYVAITEQGGDHFAGEAKAALPSASYFANGKDSGRSYYNSTIENAVRAPDPYVKAKDSWIVRRLAPDHAKIELGELPSLSDEKLLLWSMGYETANIHLGTKGAAKSILPDLAARPNGWLMDAVNAMTKSTLSDQSDWKKYMKKQ
jgi:hypothetical protein